MMRLPCIMCFSSSVICLLVVTCHGSISNAYHSELGFPEGKDGSRIQDTSHISSRNSSELNHPSSGVHMVNSTYPENQNIVSTSTAQQKLLAENVKTKHLSFKNSTYLKRKRRGASENIRLPLPKHIEESSPLGNGHHSPQDASLTNGRSLSHTSNSTTNGQTSGNSDFHNHPVRQGNHDHSSHDEISHFGSENHHNGKKEETSVHAHGSHEQESDKHHHVHPCGEDEHKHRGEGFAEERDGHSHEPSADFHQHYKSTTQNISGRVWLYASLAVIVISLCGLISVAVIPIMQKWFYHTLLQFLVGLAVGSLSGDGLLHLMPHAILDGEDTHDHSLEGHHHTGAQSMKALEMKAIWRGLAALAGIFFFFVAERLLGALTTYRRQKREAKASMHTKNMLPVPTEEGANNGSVGEKLAQPKKNSYDHIREKDAKETIQMLQAEASPSKKGSNQSIHEVGFHGRSSFSIEPEVTVTYRPDSDSSVIVSEHHGHGHAHSHEIPQSVSAVAWMVIMGDGLHNFCDGLAIGAAFASGDADGISTTVAVFCHELPHELGDFAMLLKTGMKVKQALFYNGLSSVLCFVGMVIGVSLGNVHSATNWVFAGTAGMFLYIALVDMLPELTIPANTSGSITISTLIVQVLGISIGICIMLLIALYEHELHSIVS